MSQLKTTEILLQNVEQGWTSELITAAGAETKTVKTSAGKVAYLKVNGAYDVTMKDNDTAKWAAVNNTHVDLSGCPIAFGTSIKLTFGGAGNAWIIYK
jgi:hypothetical protein